MAFTPAILEPEDFDEIRDRLGGVTVEDLPDETVMKTSYLQRAELALRRRLEGWQDMLADGDQAVELKTAAIALTACLLIPRVQQLVRSQQITDYSVTALSMDDWEKKAAQLLKEYGDAVAQLGQASGSFEPPAAFALASPSSLTDIERP